MINHETSFVRQFTMTASSVSSVAVKKVNNIWQQNCKRLLC